MTGESDARFEDARPAPLRLRAMDPDDLRVVSSLVQDAVFPASEMVWQRRHRRFALLLNRFRWEDALARGTEPERVRSVLAVEDVLAVRSRGIDRGDAGAVLSLLSIDWNAGPETTGVLTLTLAGGGGLEIGVEALEVTLRDVTRPYLAPSRRIPGHPD